MGTENQKTNNDLFEMLKDIETQNSRIAQQNESIQADILDIKSDLERQNLKTLELEQKISNLEAENIDLREKISRLEQQEKKKNILLFNLEEEQIGRDKLEKKFVDFCSDKLQAQISEQDISDIHRLGKESSSKTRPVLVEFVRTTTKQIILGSASKLKGTKYSISNDLIPELREKQKILVKHLKEAREKGYTAKVKNYKLLINGETFTAEQLEESEKSRQPSLNLNKTIKPVSKPSTPSVPETFEFNDSVGISPQNPPASGTRNRANSLKNSLKNKQPESENSAPPAKKIKK